MTPPEPTPPTAPRSPVDAASRAEQPAGGDLAGATAGWRLRNLPWLLSSLDTPGQAVGFLGPNWYASIMGTGIVANAAATLPMFADRLHVFALAVWVLDAVLLVALSAAVAAHWIRHPRVARGHAHDASMSQFYGAPPMAMMPSAPARC